MSALSDVANVQLRDIAVAGDVRDDPQWRALLGQGRKRRRIKHTPGGHPHNQQDHAGDGIPDVPNPLDKLKLASRIHLGPGEKLLSSQRIRTRAEADGWDLMTAEIDTPNGRQVRLGIIYPDDSKHWTAGPDPKRSSRIAELDQEIARLEEMQDIPDERQERLEELQSERRELRDFDADDLNRTAVITPSAAGRMRADIDAGIERAKAWSKAWKKLSDEYDDVESDTDISAEERQTQLARIEARFAALGDNEQYFIEGSLSGGPEGDLHYLVGGRDDGEGGWKIELGIKPPAAGDSWYIGSEGNAAVFGDGDVRKLLKALQELEPGDQGKSSRRATQAKHGSHNQENHGNRGVDLIPPMAGLPVLDDEAYEKEYGTVLDERSISGADGIDLQVRVFELGDAHVVLDLPGGRHQVMSDFDDTDGMRALADDIRAMRDTEIPDVEPAGELIADADSHRHDYYTGVDDLGNIWLRSSDQAEDDYLELSEDEANDLANALDDLADSLDEEFGDAAEIEIVGGKSLRKHGTHDQRTHGRRRAGAVLDVPDVPAPKPVAEPKPPKPSRAPKPKPKPKPPSEAPKPATASWTADVAKVGDMFATGPSAEPTPEQLATMNTVFAGTHADLQTKDVRMRFIGKSTVEFNGGIFDQQGARVGFFSRTMTRESDGTISATHDRLTLDPTVRGQGFAQSFNGRLIEWYKASGVKQVQLSANIDVGGYAWARAGYDWYDEDAIADPFKQLKWVAAGRRTQRIPAERLDEQKAQAAAMVKRFETAEFGSADFPTPYELSQVGRWPGAGRDDWWAGKAAMMGSSWDGVKPL